jgi:hypothetical protein
MGQDYPKWLGLILSGGLIAVYGRGHFYVSLRITSNGNRRNIWKQLAPFDVNYPLTPAQWLPKPATS